MLDLSPYASLHTYVVRDPSREARGYMRRLLAQGRSFRLTPEPHGVFEIDSPGLDTVRYAPGR